MRVALLAYYFPPLGGMGSLRALGFARHLGEFGVDVTVVAPRGGTFRTDPSLTLPAGLRVVRTRTLEPGMLVRRAAGGGGQVAERPRGGRLAGVKGLLQRLVHVPDASVGWALPAAAAAVRARPDLVLSSAPPLSAHLAAVRAARQLGVPAVLDFRDYPETQRAFRGWRERVDRRFEDLVLRRAGGLAAASAGILDVLGERSPAPGITVRNGYDEADFAGPPPPRREGPFRLVHVGTTYADRTDATPLLRALAAVPEPVVLRVVGRTDPALLEAAHSLGAGDRVESVGFVDHAAAVREMRRADALLLYMWEHLPGTGAGQMLGKTAECLRAGPPVLALFPERSENGAVLEETGGCVVVERDDERAVAAALGALVRGDRPAPADPAWLRLHTRRAGAGRMAEFLRGLVVSGR